MPPLSPPSTGPPKTLRSRAHSRLPTSTTLPLVSSHHPVSFLIACDKPQFSYEVETFLVILFSPSFRFSETVTFKDVGAKGSKVFAGLTSKAAGLGVNGGFSFKNDVAATKFTTTYPINKDLAPSVDLSVLVRFVPSASNFSPAPLLGPMRRRFSSASPPLTLSPPPPSLLPSPGVPSLASLRLSSTGTSLRPLLPLQFLLVLTVP